MELKPFLTVTPDVLESLDKIMESGSRGVHLLFSNGMIRESMSRESPLEDLSDQGLADRLQKVLHNLFAFDDLDERQEYIQSLERRVRDLLVHLYFGFLDRYMDTIPTLELKSSCLH